MMIGLKKQFLLAAVFLLAACNQNNLSPIPDYTVNLQLNLNTEYATFTSPCQYLTFTERHLETDRIGYGGILVYIGFDSQYYAFDLACPYECEPTVRVVPNDLGEAACESCGEVYDVSYGYGLPKNGICRYSLKSYKVRNSRNILYITLK